MNEIALDGPVLCFGGSYSNLQATQALFAEARRLGVPPGRMVCTGDVVAYCAHPAATLDLVIESGVRAVMGNCEESLAAGAEDCGCGFAEGTECDLLSRGWFAHASRAVSGRHRAWMGALPRRLVLRIAGRRLAVVHGGACSVNRFLFASAPDAALVSEVAATGCDGVVAGHCGLPFTRILGCGALWHNAGAIGMPADDGTPRTWFSLLVPRDGGLEVEHRALGYDHRAAAAAMRAAGLAEGYAAALGNGVWPSCDVLPESERSRRGRPLSPASVFWQRNAATPG